MSLCLNNYSKVIALAKRLNAYAAAEAIFYHRKALTPSQDMELLRTADHFRVAFNTDS